MPAGNNRNFLALGRLAAEKGVRLFAAAAREEGVDAVFAGDGYLRDEVARIAPRAAVTGWLDAAGVNRQLATARALVFPSQWPEAQGLAVLEAAARGVPAIVSDGCAARESIADGVDGLLFRSGDLADLRRKLALLADDALVARLGRIAYERYWRNPTTPERHAAALGELYSEILAEWAVPAWVGGHESCARA